MGLSCKKMDDKLATTIVSKFKCRQWESNPKLDEIVMQPDIMCSRRGRMKAPVAEEYYYLYKLKERCVKQRKRYE